jgi:hypothetical protein
MTFPGIGSPWDRWIILLVNLLISKKRNQQALSLTRSPAGPGSRALRGKILAKLLVSKD